MSPQECKIARFTQNQIEMRPISLALAPYPTRDPDHTEHITVQYYIANCVGWVPRLTWLNLQTNWTY